MNGGGKRVQKSDYMHPAYLHYSWHLHIVSGGCSKTLNGDTTFYSSRIQWLLGGNPRTHSVITYISGNSNSNTYLNCRFCPSIHLGSDKRSHLGDLCNHRGRDTGSDHNRRYLRMAGIREGDNNSTIRFIKNRKITQVWQPKEVDNRKLNTYLSDNCDLGTHQDRCMSRSWQRRYRCLHSNTPRSNNRQCLCGKQHQSVLLTKLLMSCNGMLNMTNVFVIS